MLRILITISIILPFNAYTTLPEEPIDLLKYTEENLHISYFNGANISRHNKSGKVPFYETNESIIYSLKLDIDQSSGSFEKLTDKIIDHAKLKRSYLALGESHLYPTTSRNYFYELSKLFIENSRNKKKACLENINSIYNFELGKYINEENFDSIETYLNNSPSRTDFTECFSNKVKHYLIYSGFFHQYRYAALFPGTFPKLAATYDPGNNINDQMNKKVEPLSVSQVDLPFVELLEANKILQKKNQTTETFRADVLALKNKLKTIKDSMVKIYGDDNPFRTLYGFLTENKSFDIANSSIMPKNSFIIFTEQSWQKDMYTIFMLEKISSMNDQNLAFFIKTIENSKYLYNRLMLEPSSDGVIPQFRFGPNDMIFPGETQVLDMMTSDGTRLFFAANPRTETLECFLQNKTVAKLNCENFFEDVTNLLNE